MKLQPKLLSICGLALLLSLSAPANNDGPGKSGPASSGRAAAATSAGIGHVFLIILENEDYSTSFGADSPAPYLAKTMPALGALLPLYYGTGHASNDNYISMISGQGPNILNQDDCKNFKDFRGTRPVKLLAGQAVGEGCVFSTDVPSLPDQLVARNLSWKGYMEDMGNTPSRESATCGHPALDTKDLTQGATAADQYATRHNPFVYFHSVIDNQNYCDQHVVSLKPLKSDLASVATTPNFVFITPNLCHDGHDSPCADGEPGGLVSANAFLEQWVPAILASPAFKQDGLLIVTFDESGGANPDSTSCCGEIATPNTPLPGIDGLGGGAVGAVLISSFIKPGTVSAVHYNHYALLRSLEDLFGLEYLGYAGALGPVSFGSDVYTEKMPQLPVKWDEQ